MKTSSKKTSGKGKKQRMFNLNWKQHKSVSVNIQFFPALFNERAQKRALCRESTQRQILSSVSCSYLGQGHEPRLSSVAT